MALPAATGEAQPREQINISNGSYGQFIPFEVPVYHGIEPRLGVSYDSSRGNGLVGVGWRLEGFSLIERATPHKGAPAFDANDIFLLDGEELVPCSVGMTSPSCTTGGTHTTKIERYLRIKRDTTANTWVITRPNGVKLTYSSIRTISGATIDPANTKQVLQADHFRWFLRTVVDTHANWVSYYYACGNGSLDNLAHCVPTLISYPNVNVNFYWITSRPDNETNGIGAGQEVIGSRLRTVRVINQDAAGTWRYTRTYGLFYSTSTPTGRSLLTQVQQYGYNSTVDSAGGITQTSYLPYIDITYTGGAGSLTSSRWATQQGAFGSASQWVTGDLNGDAKADFVRTSVSSCTIEVRISNGSGFASQQWTVTPAGGVSCSNSGTWNAGDFDGDGKTDLSVICCSGSSWSAYVYRSTGSGFSVSQWTNAQGTWPAGYLFVPGDFNADGRMDFVASTAATYTSGAPSLDVHFSTGSAFSLQTRAVTGTNLGAVGHLEPVDLNGDGETDLLRRAWTDNPAPSNDAYVVYTLFSRNGSSFENRLMPIYVLPNSTSDRWLKADLNGDRKTDLVRFYPSGSALGVHEWRSNGAGFEFSSYVSTFGTSTLLNANYQWRVGDFNGDGRQDFAVYDTAQTTTSYTVILKTPHFYTQEVWESAVGAPNGAAADFNGDGKADLATFWSDGGNWTSDVHVSGGVIPDLVTTYKHVLGGTETISYVPSSTWSNTNLPMVLQTVSTVTRNPLSGSFSAIATTSYEYEGGLWDAPSRRFLGFETVIETLPCLPGESVCPETRTSFLQSVASYISPESVREYDGSGNLLRETQYDYAVNDTVLPYHAQSIAQWNIQHIGSTTKRTKLSRSFDEYGNVLQEIQYGDFDVSGDEVTKDVGYAPNTTDYLLSFPASSSTYAGVGTTGTLLAQSYLYYDSASAWTTPPVKGDLTQTARWLDTVAGYVYTHGEYDTYGNLTAETDALGNRTEHIYDSAWHRFVVETRDPLYLAGDLRHKTTAVYNLGRGTAVETREFNNLLTTSLHDVFFRPTRTNFSGGGFIHNFYVNIGTPAGQFVETQMPAADGSSQVPYTRQVLDGFGREFRYVARGTLANSITDRTLNARGNVATETAPYYLGVDPIQTTTFTYDALDRVIRREHPDSNAVETSYDLGVAFDATTVTDELGRPVTLHRDAYGRVVQQDRTLGGVAVSTCYEWDLLGRLITITDDAGNQWEYGYDTLGRRISAVDPDLGSWAYEYDNAGRLTQQTDALGQVTEFTYDALNRILTRVMRAGTPQAETITYTYDEDRAGYFNVGYLTTASNTVETITYDYDADGRLVSETHVVDANSYTTATGYDVGGRVRWITYPDGDSVGSSSNQVQYDVAGRLIAVPGIITSATYNARTEPVTFTLANGVTTTYARSVQRGWLTGITTTSGSTTVQDLVYGRDVAGRITGVTSGVTGEDWTYGYDDLDRLLSATNIDTPALSQSFTYDSVGNMTSNTAVGTYTYPLPGAVRPHGVTATPLGSYGYDANGNMTSAVGDSLIYDGANRLVSVNSVQFVYGADGNRLKKIAGGTTTLYLGPDIEVVGGVATKYLLGDARRTGTGGSAVTHWLHRDYLQSVRVLTDATGAIAQRGQYKPYGEQLGMAGPVAEAKGYIGERHDAETGLIYLNARYYDPVLARFVQPDPSNPTMAGVGVNRYSYAGNNPIAFVDPTGLSDAPPIGFELWMHQGLTFAYEKAQDFNLGVRGIGLVQNIAGWAEFGVGAAACDTGVGCVLGGFLMVHGADLIGAGGRTMETGVLHDPLGSQALQSAGLDRDTANLVYDVAGAAGTAKVAALALLGPQVPLGDSALRSVTANTTAAVGVSVETAGARMALGLYDEGALISFATKHGATTSMSWGVGGKNWQEAFMNLMSKPSTRAVFNLDGINVWAGVTRAETYGIRAGNTNWELLQIRTHPEWWDRIDWYRNGDIVPNPFAQWTRP